MPYSALPCPGVLDLSYGRIDPTLTFPTGGSGALDLRLERGWHNIEDHWLVRSKGIILIAVLGPAEIDVPVESGIKWTGICILWVQETNVHNSRHDGPFAPSNVTLSCSINSVSATYPIWQFASRPPGTVAAACTENFTASFCSIASARVVPGRSGTIQTLFGPCANTKTLRIRLTPQPSSSTTCFHAPSTSLPLLSNEGCL
jgi:hypothetical protein